jgi:hypothetical protein
LAEPLGATSRYGMLIGLAAVYAGMAVGRVL